MNIKVVTDTIHIDELVEISKETYFPMIKGVVDIENEVIAFGGEYHMNQSTERTTLFLMCNLGIEIKRFFSYGDKDGDMMQMSAARSRKIISEIYQKADMLDRSIELEKLMYIIDDKINLHKLTIRKSDMDSYFKPFINRFYSTV